MEFVEGRSGAQLLQRDGALDPATAVEIAAQACAGLDYAHRRGIIHRDVKPGNLMVIGGPAGGPPMTVKLTDFGIARAAEQTRLTQVGSVVGTAAYLSPEQSRGEEATPTTDVYSLGVVIYQLLTGRLPYEGNSLAELAIRQQNERPLPPTSYDTEIPEALGGAVLRALEGDPSAATSAPTSWPAACAGPAGEDGRRRSRRARRRPRCSAASTARAASTSRRTERAPPRRAARRPRARPHRAGPPPPAPIAPPRRRSAAPSPASPAS